MTSLATFGETMVRLSPPTGERLETARSLEYRTAGAESNVAIVASRLGVDTTWLSKLPDSPLGRKVVGDLRRHGVETSITWSKNERQGTYYLEFGGEPRGTDVIYDREGAAITTASFDQVDVQVIRNADVFYTSGITPALSSDVRQTVRQLIEEARNAETRTAFDLNYRSKLWSPTAARECFEELFPNVDVLVAAQRDVRSVLDRSGSPEQLAEELYDQYSFETVILTLGSDGALAVNSTGTYRQVAFDAETLDPIGTGDAFVGAFLTRRINGDTIAEALEYAAATAAIKRTLSGDAAVVTPSEVDSLLTTNENSISR